MDNKLYETFQAETITEEMLSAAAVLFSENYGVWAEGAGERLGFKADADHVLPSSSFTRVTFNGVLAGTSFATRWSAGPRPIRWITQLGVHRSYRERGLATGLLSSFRHASDDVYGILSSHPAACVAAAKAFSGLSGFPADLTLIANNAEDMMASSPIPTFAPRL